MFIKEISKYGLVKVAFNETMISVGDPHTKINSSVLELDIEPLDFERKSLLSFSWKVKDFTQNQMLI